MGTISTGVGLISGLNIQDLVKQLMALEARPLNLLKNRITQAQQQQVAYTELSARLLAAKSAISLLAKPTAFSVRSATSSDEEVATATATDAASPGSFTFQVKSLVTTHQLVSSGFADPSTTPVGAGTLTFEIGRGNVAPSTSLADLNGGQGIRRGIIRIVDRNGGSADIDLRTATDINEVIDAINEQSTARVRAAASGDSLVITDQTGLNTGALTISDLGGGFAAADLGLAGLSSSGEIVGQDVVSLRDGTRLDRLNDGNGVRIAGIADDLRFTLSDGSQIDVNLSGLLKFTTKLDELNDGRGVRDGTIRITNRAGVSANIDLSAAQTVQDVVTAINGSGISISASLSGSKISIADTSGGTSNLKIEDVSGDAAADLGILTDIAANGLTGSVIYRIDSVGGVLRAIQYAVNNDGALSAAVHDPTGNGLALTDNSGGGGAASVAALNGSHAAEDLGLLGGFSGTTLTSRHLIAGLNTVLLSSLNGGRGVDTSALSITRQVGGSSSIEAIDVSQATTLQDVIDAINAITDVNDDPIFRAEATPGGTGITVTDIGGGTITAVSGATADDLQLAVTADSRAASGDLNLRYISDNTRLSDLNGGSGIQFGRLRITASNSASGIVTLTEASHKTIGDVIKAINNLGINVTAQVNADGDGLELIDSAGGAGTLTVSDDPGGTTAADLGIAGTATGTTLTGTFARTIQIDSNDTLNDVVTLINGSKAGVRASVINDGSAGTPYRLILTSTTSGTKGRVTFSTGTTGLSFGELAEARDAKFVVGDLDSASALVVTSGSNTVKDVVQGLTLQLHGVSDDPVQVTVAPDVDQVVTSIQTFVKTFNDALDRMDDLTKFVPETNERGILLGDAAVLQVRDRLYSRLTATLNVPGAALNRLSQVGLTIGHGARLSLDEDRFRAAFEKDPDGVTKLFTLLTQDDSGKSVKVGLAARLDEELDAITNSADGVLTRRRNTIQDRVDLFNSRAADMQKLLDLKEARLNAQFQAMESALASLQGQQAALGSLAGAVASFNTPRTA